MNHRALLLAALLISPLAQASDCTVVEVQNVRPTQGAVMLAVYTDGADYNRKPLASQRQLAGSAELLRFAVCNLQGQPVALSLVQDLNANGRMDFNPIGLPAEPWGTSGTVPAMSAPTWDSSKVVLNGQPLVIRLSQ